MNEKEIAYREGYAKGYQDAKKEERHVRWIPIGGVDELYITEQTENALRKLGEHREEVDFDYNAED